jgi:hypothetical protein
MCRPSCNSDRGDGTRMLRRTAPLHRTSLCPWHGGPDVAKVRSVTEISGLRVQVETCNAPKGPLQCKRCQRFGHTQRNCGYAPRCVACGDAHPSGMCVTPKQQLKCCNCGGNHIANYRGCSKWKEAKAAAAKRAQIERGRRDDVSTRVHAPKSAPSMPTPEQEALDSGWNHVVQGVVLSKLTLLPLQPPPHPIWTDGPSGRLSTQTAPVSPLVLRRR